MKQPATAPTITVRNTPTGWVADFSSHPEGPETFRLFGTHELPLPLTRLASFEAAVETLSKGHPEARVIESTFKSQVRRFTRQSRRPADPRQDRLDSFDA